MWLRWLVSNYVRQAAQQKLGEMASQHLRADGRRAGSPEESDATGTGTEGMDEDDPSALPETTPANQEQAKPRPDFDIAVLFALKIESGGTVDLLSDMEYSRCASYVEYVGYLGRRPVLIADTGVGQKQAGKAVEDIIALAKPKWIISAGFCGALTENLSRGQVLMADRIIDAGDGSEDHQGENEIEVGFKMNPQTIQRIPHLAVGPLLTVDELIRTREQKEQLHAKYQAVACDMESMAIARACHASGIGFLSVRIVSDALDDDLPQEIAPMMQQKSLAGKLGAATGAIFKRPSSVKDMWKLREEAIRQSDRLAKLLQGVIEQL